MSSAVPETSAVRQAPLGQVSRNNPAGADSSDQTSPFAALLEATDAGTQLPLALLAQSAPGLASPKPSLRPHDNVQLSPAAGTAAAPSSSSKNAANGPDAPQSPQSGTQTSAAPTPAPVDASSNSDDDSDQTNDAGASTDPTPAIPVADALAASSTASADVAGSTTAAIPDTRTDKPKGDPKGNQGASPPVDPSASLSVLTTQPPAIPLSAPSLPNTPPGAPSGTDADGGTAAAEEVGAAGDGSQAPAPTGKADGRPAPQDGTAPPANAAPPSSANPQSEPNLIAAEASQQAGAAQAAQSNQASAGNAGNVASADEEAASEAASARARERTANSQATDQPDASQSGPSVDPNAGSTGASASAGSNAAPSLDASGSPTSDSGGTKPAPTSRIEDAARAALDSTPQASPFAAAGSAHPGNLQAGSSQAATAMGSIGSAVVPAILTTAAAPAAAPAGTPTPPAVPISGLAVEIAASAQAGKNQFDIRLDPPELGRIQVQLSVDHDGKVTSRLVVDRPETLDLLQRDASDLQRSLQQSGLQTSDNGLQFSLRDQGGFAGQNPYSNNGSSGSARIIIPDSQAPSVDAGASTYSRALGASGGIDIRV
ncbi:MAG TPA: flagellar hook-length control protein FliK [Xanthobacteraceae bacterium]|nr:flagellar hook-length control protein FliK [Xanthobacteraceae bacterium]